MLYLTKWSKLITIDMPNKIQGVLAIVVAIIVLFSAMWNPMLSIVLAVVALVVFGFFQFYAKRQLGSIIQDDAQGDPLNPEQIAKRKENLNKILEMAQTKERLTNDYIQKELGVSDATATRYCEYLVSLNKLARMGERGQQVYYVKR